MVHEDLIADDLQKTSLCDFGRHFFRSKHVGRHFCSYFQGVCSDFQGFCEGFHRFCQISTNFALIFREFAQISPNQSFLGCACTPASYTTVKGGLNPERQLRKAGTQYTLRLIGVVPSIDKPWLAWEKHFFEWLYKSLPCMFVVRTTAECRHFVAWNFMTGALTTPNAINSVCKFEGLEKY